jgi:uncharacterized membrane protein YfcA
VTALVLAAAAFIAWLVSTVAGGAGGLLLVPVIQFLLGARAVAPVVTLGVFVGGPVRVWLFWQHVQWEIVRWYLPAAVVGAAIGGWIFANTKSEWLTIIVALFLISSIVQFRFGEKKRSFPMPRWAFAPLGFVVSLLSGIVGALGPVLNPFYINYGVQKEGMIATKSVNSLAMHLVKLGSYTVFGAMEMEYVRYGLVVGAAASLASWIGKRLLGKMTNKLFRQLVVGVMVLTGFMMLWQQRHVLGWG